MQAKFSVHSQTNLKRIDRLNDSPYVFCLLGAINIHRFVCRDIEQRFVNEVDRKEVFQCL